MAVSRARSAEGQMPTDGLGGGQSSLRAVSHEDVDLGSLATGNAGRDAVSRRLVAALLQETGVDVADGARAVSLGVEIERALFDACRGSDGVTDGAGVASEDGEGSGGASTAQIDADADGERMAKRQRSADTAALNARSNDSSGCGGGREQAAAGRLERAVSSSGSAAAAASDDSGAHGVATGGVAAVAASGPAAATVAVGKGYGPRVIATVAALRRRDGAALRSRLLCGALGVKELAGMPFDQLASAVVRQERQAIRAAAAVPFDSMSDATLAGLPCPSCGSKRVLAKDVSSQRDIRKAEIWGGGGTGGDGTRRRCVCEACGLTWTDEA